MMVEWKSKAIELAKQNYSWRKISETVGQPKSTVSDFLRAEFGKPSKIANASFAVRKLDAATENNDRILIISDMHIPYQHPDALEFLAYLKKKYKPTRVICTGDELDKHALSFHDHDPDLMSAGDELKKSQEVIAKLYQMFPKMDIIESNHGSLVWRKAKTNGIPKHYIKSYNEVLGVGPSWKWSFDLTVKLPNGQNCYFHHGKSSNVVQLSQQMGMCAVQGHYHNSFSVGYWGNSTGLYWGLQVGCLVDDDSLAFSYNNVNIQRPIIGTGLIINSMPILEPLVMDSEGRWVGRVK
jgi:hypothetical protein